MFQCFNLNKIKKKFYILSEASNWQKKAITNDEHKINNL